MEATDLGINGLVDIEQIGRGGSSRVYRARQPEFDRQVALKVLTTGATADGLERFDRERKALGRLSLNPGVVPVYSSGTTDGDEPYLVMPFYKDGSLADRMAAGPVPWTEAVDLMAGVARTIAAAHQSNVVHLDIKPANVLLTADGATRIADFGIAKVLRHTAEQVLSSGTSFTPAYSAPEIVRGQAVTTTADVYGLGATLWALLAGRPPFRVEDGDNSVLAVTGRVIHSPVGDLRHLVPSEICDVVEQAMAKDPSDRFPTASAFARALSEARRRAERHPAGPPNRLVPQPPSLQLADGLDAGLLNPTVDLGPALTAPGPADPPGPTDPPTGPADPPLPADGTGPACGSTDDEAGLVGRGDRRRDPMALPPLSSHPAANPVGHEPAPALGHRPISALEQRSSSRIDRHLDAVRRLADRTPDRHLVAAVLAVAAVTIGTLGLVARSGSGAAGEVSDLRSTTSAPASTTSDQRPGSSSATVATTGSTAEATVTVESADPAGTAPATAPATTPGATRRPASRPTATPPATTRSVRSSDTTAPPTDPPTTPTSSAAPTTAENSTMPSTPTPAAAAPSSTVPSTNRPPRIPAPNPPPTSTASTTAPTVTPPASSAPPSSSPPPAD
ncbi:MAG: protein kinase domain-containing protein [Acidimicrobiales bacterium]